MPRDATAERHRIIRRGGERDQRYLPDAIREDRDLTADLRDAVGSLRIVLAADQSVRTGRAVTLAR